MKLRRTLVFAGALLLVVWAGHLALVYQARATITSAQNSITALGNGATTVFTFPFVGVKAGDITVIYTNAAGAQTTLTQGSQYTIALNAPTSGQVWGVGGTITYPLSGSPIAAGTTLTIARAVPYTQTISSSQGQSFSTTVEAALDLLAMQIQQIASTVNRALSVSITDTCASFGNLPAAAQRASQMIGFDATGCNPITAQPSSALVSSAMQPVVSAATTGDALTALGVSAIYNVPVGAELDWPGITAPTYWKLEDGSAISRTTYSALLPVVAPIVACTISSGSATITGLSSSVTAQVAPGMVIESPGSSALGNGKTIATVGGSSVTISGGNATGNATSCQIFPYGTAQDGTFNLPDARGVSYAMRDQAGTRITSTYCGGDPTKLNALCGAESAALAAGNLPPHYHGVYLNDPGHGHGVSGGGALIGDNGGAQLANGPNRNYNTGITILSNTTGVTVRDVAGGGGNANRTATTGSTMSAAPFSVLSPMRIRNKIIFAGAP